VLSYFFSFGSICSLDTAFAQKKKPSPEENGLILLSCNDPNPFLEQANNRCCKNKGNMEKHRVHHFETKERKYFKTQIGKENLLVRVTRMLSKGA